MTILLYCLKKIGSSDEKPADILKKHLKDEFENVPKEVLKMVENSCIDINNKEDVEDLLAKESNEFVWMFSTFLIARCYATASVIPEFGNEGQSSNDGEKYLSPNHSKFSHHYQLDIVSVSQSHH